MPTFASRLDTKMLFILGKTTMLGSGGEDDWAGGMIG
jgi:hypothetical protein